MRTRHPSLTRLDERDNTHIAPARAPSEHKRSCNKLREIENRQLRVDSTIRDLSEGDRLELNGGICVIFFVLVSFISISSRPVHVECAQLNSANSNFFSNYPQGKVDSRPNVFHEMKALFSAVFLVPGIGDCIQIHNKSILSAVLSVLDYQISYSITTNIRRVYINFVIW